MHAFVSVSPPNNNISFIDSVKSILGFLICLRACSKAIFAYPIFGDPGIGFSFLLSLTHKFTSLLHFCKYSLEYFLAPLISLGFCIRYDINKI